MGIQDELDGTLARSAITVEGVAQYQWEYLKPRNEVRSNHSTDKFNHLG